MISKELVRFINFTISPYSPYRVLRPSCMLKFKGQDKTVGSPHSPALLPNVRKPVRLCKLQWCFSRLSGLRGWLPVCVHPEFRAAREKLVEESLFLCLMLLRQRRTIAGILYVHAFLMSHEQICEAKVKVCLMENSAKAKFTFLTWWDLLRREQQTGRLQQYQWYFKQQLTHFCFLTMISKTWPFCHFYGHSSRERKEKECTFLFYREMAAERQILHSLS